MVGLVTECRACGGRLSVTMADLGLQPPSNLQEEIRRQLHGIAAWGGKFVTPVPMVRVHS
jgi:hypothetical protein